MAKKNIYKQKNYNRKFIRFFWGFFIFFISAGFILFFGAALGIYGPMPDLQELENPKTNLATQIISADAVSYTHLTLPTIYSV